MIDETSINNGININSSQTTGRQEILKSFQEPKHSAEYIKHREEIVARNVYVSNITYIYICVCIYIYDNFINNLTT